MSTPVEKEYLRRLEERGPMFGMQQCAQALQAVREMLRLQVLREQPGISPAGLQVETARRLYYGDDAAQRLLDLACRDHE